MTKTQKYASRSFIAAVGAIALLTPRSALAILAYEDQIKIGGFCVAASNPSTGSPLQLVACSGGADQAWTFTPDNLIVNSATGACIGTAGASLANYTTLEPLACDSNAPSQRWFYDQGTRTIQNVSQAIQTANHGAAVVPQLPSVFSLANFGAITAGNTLIAFQYHDGIDQFFDVVQTTTAGMMGSHGFYATTADGNMNDGETLVIEPVWSTWGGTPSQPPDSGMQPQPARSVWVRTRGGLVINSSSGKCLSTGNFASLANGTPFIVFACHGTVDQYWNYGVGDAWFNTSFGRTSFDGTQLWPLISLANYGAFTAGNELMVWENHNGDDQKGWFLY